MRRKGFILLGFLFMMVLLAVAALALNRRAGLQGAMAVNQMRSVQTALSQEAALEDAVYELTKDPFWRTASSGEDYTYQGATYNRKALSSTQAGYTDSVTISVTSSGAVASKKASYRYYLTDILSQKSPYQVCCDASDNIYFADKDGHSIFKIAAGSGIISRVAGNGTSGFSGDGGPATLARLNKPCGVWVDNAGAIYIGDSENHCIRRVSLAGIITTVAGQGELSGYSGDGGPATSAKMNSPRGICVDAIGNIYVADTKNHVIRMVSAATGNITTVAGNGDSGSSGDGGLATNARLDEPDGVYVTAANDIYIADTDNCWIRKVNASTGIITRIAGLGQLVRCFYSGDGGPATLAALEKPSGVFVDALGNIYVADTRNNRIRRFTEGGNIYTIAGNGVAGYSGDGGPAVNAALDTPRSICLAGTGEVVIADTVNSCIRKVDLVNQISSLTGSGVTGLDKPTRISMDSAGDILIADTDNHRVRKMAPSGLITTVAGTGSVGYAGDGGPAPDANLNSPHDVVQAPSGNIYIADTGNHCVRRITAATGNISTFVGTGSGGFNGNSGNGTAIMLNRPGGLYVITNYLYIADTENNLIRRVDGSAWVTTIAGNGSAGFSGDGGAAIAAQLNKPQDIHRDSLGNLYIADTGNHCIRKVDISGNISTIAGTPPAKGYSGDGGPATGAAMDEPGSVFLDSNGNIFISDQKNDVIRAIDAHDGTIHTLAGTGIGGFNGDDQPAVQTKLKSPAGLTMAPSRGGGKIYISDKENSRIRILSFKLVKELH